MGRTNAFHAVYKLSNGIRVPSVTTVLNLLSKPALIHWAWQLGIEQKDYRKVRDQAAEIGTIAHEMIRCHLKNVDFDSSEYAPVDIDKAENAFIAYLDWEKLNHVCSICIEQQFVSENYRFGGTIDLYADLNKQGMALIDFKTSSGVYPEMKVQVACYAHLLIENGYKIDNIHLLRIGKEDGMFQDHQLGTTADLDDHWELFKHLRNAYDYHKKVFKRGA